MVGRLGRGRMASRRRGERTVTSPHRLITTRNEFHQALRDGFAEIASVGCREVWICDDDFADWPLNERAVVESLTQWAQSHRKLTVIARTFEEFPLRHARWVEWPLLAHGIRPRAPSRDAT